MQNGRSCAIKERRSLTSGRKRVRVLDLQQAPGPTKATRTKREGAGVRKLKKGLLTGLPDQYPPPIEFGNVHMRLMVGTVIIENGVPEYGCSFNPLDQIPCLLHKFQRGGTYIHSGLTSVHHACLKQRRSGSPDV